MFEISGDKVKDKDKNQLNLAINWS